MNVKRYLLPDFTVILNFISTCKNRGMFIKRKINTQVKITHTNMFNNTGKKYWFKYFMMWAHDYLVLLIKSIRHRTTGSIILHSQKIINICHIHVSIYLYIFICTLTDLNYVSESHLIYHRCMRYDKKNTFNTTLIWLNVIVE